jgi:hypothetical protein
MSKHITNHITSQLNNLVENNNSCHYLHWDGMDGWDDIGMAKSLREELRPWGIHVSNINPAFMK